MTAPAFERIVEIEPAYDKRHPDPDRSYGYSDAHIRMVLKGPAGAVQFVASTGWYLPHVHDERTARPPRHAGPPLEGWDLGYHSPTPQWDGQERYSDEPCPYIGVPCYYDGSGLQAAPIAALLLEEGSEAVWARLEERYHALFGGEA